MPGYVRYTLRIDCDSHRYLEKTDRSHCRVWGWYSGSVRKSWKRAMPWGIASRARSDTEFPIAILSLSSLGDAGSAVEWPFVQAETQTDFILDPSALTALHAGEGHFSNFMWHCARSTVFSWCKLIQFDGLVGFEEAVYWPVGKRSI